MLINKKIFKFIIRIIQKYYIDRIKKNNLEFVIQYEFCVKKNFQFCILMKIDGEKFLIHIY